MEGQLQLDDQYLILKEVIGKGAFARVVKGIDSKNNQHIACKLVQKQKLKENPVLDNLFAQEIQLQRKLQSPFIIKLHKVYDVDNYYMLIMEYCEGGDLDKYLQKNGPIQEQKAIGFLMQILAGFREIHSHSIIYREIKPSNIFMKGNQLKIGDFGCARAAYIDQLNAGKSVIGLSYYKAPELIENQVEYGFEVDIYSLGVLLYRILFNSYPFDGQSPQEIYKKMQSANIDFNKNGVDISKEMKDFLSRLLKFDRNERMTWYQIYQHPIISKNFRSNSISAENFCAPQYIDFQLYLDPKFTNKKYSTTVKMQQNQLQTSQIAEENKQKNFPQQQIDGEKKKILADLKETKEKEFQYAIKQYCQKINIYYQMRELVKKFQNIKSVNYSIPAFLVQKKMKNLIQELQNSINQRINIFNLKYFNDFLNIDEFEKFQKLINDEATKVDQYLNSTQQSAIESVQNYQIDPTLLEELKTFQCTPQFQNLYVESLTEYASAVNQLLKSTEDPIQKKFIFYQIVLVYDVCSIDKHVLENIEFNLQQYSQQILKTDPEKYQQIIEQKLAECLS